MPRLVATVTTSTLADHRTVAVLDEGGAIPWPSSRGWLDVADDGIHLTTVASEEDVPLTVEVWDAEPPPPPGPWAAAGTGTLRFTTGRLAVNPLVEGDDTVGILAGPGRWVVRALAGGRPDLAGEATGDRPDGEAEAGAGEETAEAGAGAEAADDGGERYHLQLWPAPGPDR